MADLTEQGLSSLKNAINMIQSGQCKRVDLGHNTAVYKVPSNNPSKFTIRIDMKFNESEEE